MDVAAGSLVRLSLRLLPGFRIDFVVDTRAHSYVEKPLLRQLDLASLLFHHIAFVCLCPMHTVVVSSRLCLIDPQPINTHVSRLLDQHDTKPHSVFSLFTQQEYYKHISDITDTSRAQEPQPASALTSCTAIITAISK